MNLFIPSLLISTVAAHQHISYCHNTLPSVLAACTVICQQYRYNKSAQCASFYHRQLLQYVQCNGDGVDIINFLVYCKMSAASQTVQQVPKNDGTNCNSDSPTPKQGKNSYQWIYVDKQLLLQLLSSNVCPVAFRPWAFSLLMAKGHTCHCGLVRGLHVEKWQ